MTDEELLAFARHTLGDHADRATIDVETAGRILGIGRSAAYCAATRGDIPTVRIGRRVVVPIAGLVRLLVEGSTRRSEPRAPLGLPTSAWTTRGRGRNMADTRADDAA